jgi:glycosyltransferase involved in cell wall biosynthesis
VATTAGGIPDAIDNGENGRLVAPGDTPALAAAMIDLIDDAELRQRLGQAARATALRDFTLEQELEKNLALYHKLL